MVKNKNKEKWNIRLMFQLSIVTSSTIKLPILFYIIDLL